MAAVLLAALCAGTWTPVNPARGAAPPPATAPAADGLILSGVDPATGAVRLIINKSTTLVTSRPYKLISVGNEEIADVNSIGPQRILVTARKAGTTQIVVTDENDISQTVEVVVQANLLALRTMFDRLLPGASIDVVDSDGMIALIGQVPTLDAAEQAQQLAGAYGTRVMNLLEVAGGQQVMLQIRFAEVSKSATSALGVNLGYSDGTSFGASNIGQVSPFGVEAGGGALGVQPTLQVSPGVTLFGVGTIGSTSVAAFVQALRENNLLRVLAEPNLVAASGQEADFLAGGDFPVPIVQGGSDQGTSITVEFREFGVRLKFTPVVLGSGRIRLKLAPEVSDVDFTNAVISQGFRIPGRRTRKLSTTVELADGQTFAVGGLLDSRVAANKAATPLLGDVPIVGALFRSVRYQRQETELVVLVTPRLVSAVGPGDVPKLPGEHWRHPNEVELFLGGDIGAPVDDEIAAKIPARRFIGRYGLIPATQPAGR